VKTQHFINDVQELISQVDENDEEEFTDSFDQVNVEGMDDHSDINHTETRSVMNLIHKKENFYGLPKICGDLYAV
jgi:hypothetical protein